MRSLAHSIASPPAVAGNRSHRRSREAWVERIRFPESSGARSRRLLLRGASIRGSREVHDGESHRGHRRRCPRRRWAGKPGGNEAPRRGSGEADPGPHHPCRDRLRPRRSHGGKRLLSEGCRDSRASDVEEKSRRDVAASSRADGARREGKGARARRRGDPHSLPRTRSHRRGSGGSPPAGEDPLHERGLPQSHFSRDALRLPLGVGRDDRARSSDGRGPLRSRPWVRRDSGDPRRGARDVSPSGGESDRRGKEAPCARALARRRARLRRTSASSKRGVSTRARRPSPFARSTRRSRGSFRSYLTGGRISRRGNPRRSIAVAPGRSR